jgi:hypothetical protein
MSKASSCVDCGTKTPEIESSYTLIHDGWRLSRRESAAGIAVEWRCKDCWRKYREQPTSPPSPLASSSARILVREKGKVRADAKLNRR